ncbi:NADH:flavin oxidoreductase [Paenibacillus sp. IHBB 10380]|uniref:NADH:flavin oxidoreductase n=1 Tax=Paenibacillus sp. IHBB 10380 TaxID=1566358 RepID=UPI0005CFBCCA|nr:NADH:flavin oxidoreductase [Paenibacillus sp. IHBB 10380]AJS59017.1 1,2-oxophytodienoate reductase [Paenibacillus sp. IHBB 10380]
MTIPALFKSFSSGNLTLSNRIVMAPMTRGFSPDGIPGHNVVDYYRRRAANGVGLIITEGTGINHPAAVSGASIPLFHGDEALNGWSQVVNAVHEAGGKIMPQLWHVGMARRKGDLPNLEAQPIGPSGYNISGEQVTEPMTEGEIEEVIKAFGQAAADAKRIGFDGIELHGAHGYLIDQFFWEKTNRRTDRYGGDAIGRTRFAVEVIEACRRAVGPDFPIILRFSQWKMGNYDAKLIETPVQLERFLAPLSEAGVDIFHCSTRRFWLSEFEGSDLNLAGWTQKLTGKPAISVGSVGLETEFVSAMPENKGMGDANLDKLAERLKNEEFDLIAVGRVLLGDPAWAAKIRDDRTAEIVPFTSETLKTLF